jgi:hypothetical protein
MENEKRSERMNDAGESFMREIEMLMTDSERKDIAEILSSVGSELPRTLETALAAGALSNDQRSEASRRLNDIREDVDRLPDSEDKKLIMKAFDALLQKLN